MTKKYTFFNLILLFFLGFYACSDDQGSSSEYTPISPVTVDLTQVPYEKLSDYHFFEGSLKNQNPSLNVLPYTPASTLFTDYALKKRFVWLPKNTKATFNGDGKVLELPVGAVLIKTFYYDNVQPSNTTRILETRLMIRKESGWIFANYVWNDEQTEAYFDLDGSDIPISWIDENNNLKNATYRIPNEVQCITCHKSEQEVNNVLITTHTPIGIKPQNLNFNYNYTDGTKNQLLKWIEEDYLENNFNLPSVQNTVVDYHDTSLPIDLRARSYVDINCAHCHSVGGHCSYRPMRFAYSDTYNNNTNMGVCVDTEDMQDFPPALSKIVTPGNIGRSMMYYRLNTEDESYRMPLHGRTIIHTEGVELIEQWINSLTPCP
ncbi:hypothetical protein NHF50_02855 [Flavobacterium sp. NRK F10]|uniref:Repeat protein (TIGR03806 family) n=1 Tax=Flavobacterium sediminis TaxID=2201181 RepID=A0A2U8QRQ7_9FLAO|nr:MULTISPECIES: hypothetical protein [Flavobacterium]AWM12843.1 hypothetical protein DI487_02470 [Flavobacterium sediminis]MCO6173974.1 hypothetical protein [Flavobacterium sp. NRK F10]